MYDANTIDSLIGKLYEAAYEKDKWGPFLSALAETLDGAVPNFFFHDTAKGSGTFLIDFGFDEASRQAYTDHYSKTNIWLRSRPQLLTEGRVRTSHMMCDRSTLLQSEWYADFLRPRGLSQAIGATIVSYGTVSSNISVFGMPQREDFAEREVQLLSLLLPHMQRSLKVHLRLAEADLKHRALADALENLTVGVILVTASSRVIYMNRAARRITNQQDALLVDRSGLRTIRSQETAKLRSLIGLAAQTSRGRGLHAGGYLSLRRQSGKQALEVMVSPISTSDSWCFKERAVATVYVTDPAQFQEPAEKSLVRQHGLTPAEARVVTLIVRGLSAREAATELEVSYNTLKTHLKHVYAKTRTTSQNELIRLIIRGTGLVDAAPERTSF